MADAYGLMAIFESPEALVAAVRRAREAGYREMDTFTPVPVEGIDEALESPPDRIALVVLVCGILGALGGYAMQFFAMAISYPLNVGGRPLNSWPSFIPVTFELTILSAAFGAFFGLLAMCGLPRLHHPTFNAPCFKLATLDRFFLCIKSTDAHYSAAETRRFLEGLRPVEVADVAL